MGKHHKDKSSVIAAKIASTAIIKDEKGKDIVFYEIQAVIESEKYGKFVISQHHRYNDFDVLHRSIVKHCRNDPEIRVIPAPPPKTFIFFTNTLTKSFIKNRKERLNSYVKALSTLRKLRSLDIVLHFFGYYPRTKSRESSVCFKSIFKYILI